MIDVLWEPIAPRFADARKEGSLTSFILFETSAAAGAARAWLLRRIDTLCGKNDNTHGSIQFHQLQGSRPRFAGEVEK